MKKALLAFFIFSSFAACYVSNGKSAAATKAVFIYNFTRNIEWTNQNKLKEFSIGILGNKNQEIYFELDSVLFNKRCNGVPFILRTFNTIDDINSVQLLYINAKDGFDRNKILKKIKGKGTLLVSDNLDEFDNSMINLLVRGSNKRFSLNQQILKEEGFKLANSILALGVKNKAAWKAFYNNKEEKK